MREHSTSFRRALMVGFHITQGASEAGGFPGLRMAAAGHATIDARIS